MRPPYATSSSSTLPPEEVLPRPSPNPPAGRWCCCASRGRRSRDGGGGRHKRRDAHRSTALRPQNGSRIAAGGRVAGTTRFHLALPPDDRNARPFGGAAFGDE